MHYNTSRLILGKLVLARSQQTSPPLTRKLAFAAGLEQQSRHIGRAQRGRIAELHGAEQPGRHCRDVGDSAGAAVEVNRVDDDAAVGATGGGDDASGLCHALGIGPRHRFDIGLEPERQREVAQRTEIVGQTRFVRIIAGNQYVAGIQRRAGFQQRLVSPDVGVRRDCLSADGQSSHIARNPGAHERHRHQNFRPGDDPHRSPFQFRDYLPFMEVGARLGAKAILVAGDEPDEARMIDQFALLCDTAYE